MNVQAAPSPSGQPHGWIVPRALAISGDSPTRAVLSAFGAEAYCRRGFGTRARQHTPPPPRPSSSSRGLRGDRGGAVRLARHAPIVLFGRRCSPPPRSLHFRRTLASLNVGHACWGLGLFCTSCIFSPIVPMFPAGSLAAGALPWPLISSGQSLSGACWPTVFQAGITEFGCRRPCWCSGVRWRRDPALGGRSSYAAPPQAAAVASGPRRSESRRARVRTFRRTVP